MPTVSHVVAERLAELGVTKVFGLMGDDTARLAVDLQRAGLDYYCTRHESVGVGMADGYARVTGELGVSLISRGPGVMNAASAIATAARAKTPVVVLTSDADPSSRGSMYTKWIDQRRLYEGIAVDYVHLDDPATAVAGVEAACERARLGATIVVNFQGELLYEHAGSAEWEGPLPPVAASSDPDPELIRYLADLLGESWAFSRPIILAGRGAVRSGARPELERLGEQCGALLGTTLMGRSLFAGAEWDLGICGSFGSDAAIELAQEADTVLAFGSSLDMFTTLNGKMFPRARVIRFDSDPAGEHTGSMPVELFIECDAQKGARALADELERRGHRETGFRHPSVAEKMSGPPRPLPPDVGSPGSLDPRQVMSRFDDVLPKERAVVVDVGHNSLFAVEHLSVPSPDAFIWSLENQCLAVSTGIALGAAVGRPDRVTVYAAGDAGTLMSLGDFETAARYSLPLVVLVSNDAALGAELHMMQTWGVSDELARIPTPSFEAIASALGMTGATVRELADIDSLREKLTDLGGPLMVEIPISTTVRHEGMDTEIELLAEVASGDVTATVPN